MANAEDACRREGDRVVCTGDGFKTLVDLAITARADATKCGLQLDACRVDVDDRDAALNACQAALDAVPPPQPPRSPIGPLVGYALGVAGASMASVALLAPLDSTPRAVAATLGLASIIGGVVLVLP